MDAPTLRTFSVMQAKRFASRVGRERRCGELFEEELSVATHRLGRDISIVLCAKLAALVVLYFAFFDSSHRPHVSPVTVAQKLFGDNASPR